MAWCCSVLLPDDGLEVGTAEELSTSLAKASPELKQCVASCKHIAETAKQQSTFQNVSSTVIRLHAFSCLSQHQRSDNSKRSCLTPGEWRVVPARPGDWQSLLYRHGVGVFYRHHRNLPDGPFQPAPLLTFPWGSKDVSPSKKYDRLPGLSLEEDLQLSSFHLKQGLPLICDLCQGHREAMEVKG